MPEETRQRRRVLKQERISLLASLLREDANLGSTRSLTDREETLQNHLLNFYITYNEGRKSSKIAPKDATRLLITLRSEKNDNIDTFLRQYRHLVRAKDKQSYEDAQKADVDWLQQKEGFEVLAEEINTPTVFGAIRRLFQRRYLRFIRRHYPIHKGIGTEERTEVVNLLSELHTEDLKTFRSFLKGFAALVKKEGDCKHDLKPYGCTGFFSLAKEDEHLKEFKNDLDDFLKNINDLVYVDREPPEKQQIQATTTRTSRQSSRADVTVTTPGLERQHSGAVRMNSQDGNKVGINPQGSSRKRRNLHVDDKGVTPRLTRGATARAAELKLQGLVQESNETDVGDASVTETENEEIDPTGQKRTQELEVTSAGRSDELVEEMNSTGDGEDQTTLRDNDGGQIIPPGLANSDGNLDPARSAAEANVRPGGQVDSPTDIDLATPQNARRDEEQTELNTGNEPISQSNRDDSVMESAATTTTTSDTLTQNYNEMECDATTTNHPAEAAPVLARQQSPSVEDQELIMAQFEDCQAGGEESMRVAPSDELHPVTEDLRTAEVEMVTSDSFQPSHTSSIPKSKAAGRSDRKNAESGVSGTISGPGRNARSRAGKPTIANPDSAKKSSGIDRVKYGAVSKRKVGSEISEARLKKLEKALKQGEDTEETDQYYDADAMEIEMKGTNQHVEIGTSAPQPGHPDFAVVGSTAPVEAGGGENRPPTSWNRPAGQTIKNSVKGIRETGKTKNSAKRLRSSAEERKIINDAEARAKGAERATRAERVKRREATKSDWRGKEHAAKEAQKYSELTTAICQHLTTAISDSLPIAEKKAPEEFDHLPEMIAAQVRSKPAVKLAHYFMAVSLLRHRGKIASGQLPESADTILQPLQNLLQKKQYQPCAHPDLSCHSIECFEQWYALCVNDPERPFEQAAAKWGLTPKTSGYIDEEHQGQSNNAIFQTHMKLKMRKFSANEEDRWKLRHSLVRSVDQIVGRCREHSEETAADHAMDLDGEQHTIAPQVEQQHDIRTPKPGGYHFEPPQRFDFHTSRKNWVQGGEGDQRESVGIREARRAYESMMLKKIEEGDVKELQKKADELQTEIAGYQDFYEHLQSKIKLLKGEKTTSEKDNVENQNDKLKGGERSSEQVDEKHQNIENQNSNFDRTAPSVSITQLVSNIINDIKEKDNLAGNLGKAREKLKDQFLSIEDGQAIFDVYCVLYNDLPSAKVNLDQEYGRAVMKVIDVMQQYFNSLNGEEPGDNGKALSLQHVPLNNKSTPGQMEAVFSAKLQELLINRSNELPSHSKIFKEILPSMRRTWDKFQKDKADLAEKVQDCSKLEIERDDNKVELQQCKLTQINERSEHAIELQKLGENLAEAKLKAKQESATAERNNQWNQATQLSLLMLRTYLEPHLLGRSIDESACKDIRKSLADGNLADIDIVHQLHAMLCSRHCTGFHIKDGKISATACEKAFQSVLPQTISPNSPVGIVFLAILSRMERLVSKHSETVAESTDINVSANKEGELAADQSSTEHVQDMEKRYSSLEEKFRLAAGENETTLDFIGWLLGCSLTNRPPSPAFKPEEKRLKQGDWADANVIKCLHTILSPSCRCGTKWWSTLSEKTYERDGFDECSQQFQRSLPNEIQATISPKYVPAYSVLSIMAEAKLLQKELQDSHSSDHAARETEEKARRAAAKEETRKACLGVIWLIEQQIDQSLSGNETESRADNLRNMLSRLEGSLADADGEGNTVWPVEYKDTSEAKRSSRQLLQQITQIRSIKSELDLKKKSLKQEEKDKNDLVHSWEACQRAAKCGEQSWTLGKIRTYIADHEVEFISLLSARAQTSSKESTETNLKPQTPQRFVTHMGTQTGPTKDYAQLYEDYQKTLQKLQIIRGLEEQESNKRNATYKLLQELAKCLNGSLPWVEQIRECIQKAGFGGEETLNALHSTLSDCAVTERVGIRQCSDHRCTASYLHGLVPGILGGENDDISELPATVDRRDAEEFFKHLKQLKAIIQSKESLRSQLADERYKTKAWRWSYAVIGIMVKRLRSTKAQLTQQGVKLDEQTAKLEILTQEKNADLKAIDKLHDDCMHARKKINRDIEGFSDEPSNSGTSISVRVQNLVENAKLITRSEMESRDESRVFTWLYILTSNSEVIRKWDETSLYGLEQQQVCDRAEAGGLRRTLVSDCLKNATNGVWRRWHEEDGKSGYPHNGNEDSPGQMVALCDKMERFLTINVGKSLDWAIQRVDKLSVDRETLPTAVAQGRATDKNMANNAANSEKLGVYISEKEYSRFQKLESKEKQLDSDIQSVAAQKRDETGKETHERSEFILELQKRYGLTYFKCLREMREKNMITPDRYYDLEREIMQYRQYYNLLALSYFAVEVDDEHETQTCKPKTDEVTAFEWAKLAGLDDTVFTKYAAMANNGELGELAKRDGADDKTMHGQSRINKQSEYIIEWMIKTQGLSLERRKQLQECSKQIHKLWKSCELSHGWAGSSKEFADLGHEGKAGTSSPAKQLAFIMERLGREVPSSHAHTAGTGPDSTEQVEFNKLDAVSQEATPNTIPAEGGRTMSDTVETSGNTHPAFSVSEVPNHTLNLQKTDQLKEILKKSARLGPMVRAPTGTYDSAPSDAVVDTYTTQTREDSRILTLLLIMDAKMAAAPENAEGEVEEILASARLGNLYCGMFVSCLEAGGFSIRKVKKDLTSATADWLRYQLVVNKIVSTKIQLREREQLHWGCSERIISLYAMHGGNTDYSVSDDVDDNNVELIRVDGDRTLSSSTAVICNRNNPLDIRLQQLVDFVSKTSKNSLFKSGQSDEILMQGQTRRPEELNAYTNESLQNRIADAVQSSLQDMGIPSVAVEEVTSRCLNSLRPQITSGGSGCIGKLCGQPLKIKEIKPHHPGYQLLIVDHNNHPHTKFQKRTGLGTILEAGSADEAMQNAEYFFGVFSRALTNTLVDAEKSLVFDFLKGVEKVAQFPACLRFEKIIDEDHEGPVLAKGCSHVLYRDGAKHWNVEHRIMKRWGKHVREALSLLK